MAGCRLRLWRYGRGRLRPVLDVGAVEPPPVQVDDAGVVTPTDADRWVAPVPDMEGYWFEIVEPERDPAEVAGTLAPLLARLIDGERDTLSLAKQLASRYEETELLYTISSILGRTIRLERAAETILREVSDVVGAHRASIFVHDESGGVLRPVAALGKDLELLHSIEVEDRESITARVFRSGRPVAYDPRRPSDPNPGIGPDRGYRGSAFLSYPIIYPTQPRHRPGPRLPRLGLPLVSHHLSHPGRRAAPHRGDQPDRPPGRRCIQRGRAATRGRRGKPDRRRHRERAPGRA
jgi:hypothetical protein